jgi:hypothetical protein
MIGCVFVKPMVPPRRIDKIAALDLYISWEVFRWFEAAFSQGIYN